MSDIITIKDLEVSSCIGIPYEERNVEQRLLISIDIEHNTKSAGENDDISKTVDYKKVIDGVKSLATKKKRKTIESFAEEISSYILDTFKPSSVQVKVKKFIISETRYVAVTITRP